MSELKVPYGVRLGITPAALHREEIIVSLNELDEHKYAVTAIDIGHRRVSLSGVAGTNMVIDRLYSDLFWDSCYLHSRMYPSITGYPLGIVIGNKLTPDGLYGLRYGDVLKDTNSKYHKVVDFKDRLLFLLPLNGASKFGTTLDALCQEYVPVYLSQDSVMVGQKIPREMIADLKAEHDKKDPNVIKDEDIEWKVVPPVPLGDQPNDEIKRLQGELREANRQIEETSRMRDWLSNDLKKAGERREHLEVECSHLGAQVTKLEKQLNQSIEEKIKTTNEFMMERQGHLNEIEHLQRSRNELQEHYEEVEESLSETKIDLIDAKKQLKDQAELEAILAEANAKVADLEKLLSSSSAKLRLACSYIKYMQEHAFTTDKIVNNNLKYSADLLDVVHDLIGLPWVGNKAKE